MLKRETDSKIYVTTRLKMQLQQQKRALWQQRKWNSSLLFQEII